MILPSSNHKPTPADKLTGPNLAAPRRRASRSLPTRFPLRRAMFVLPNLFTISSIFCGFYAMLLVMDQPGSAELYRATLAVFFAIFFDMADGRVARLTKTQSDFGMQLDSLADVISFGVTPALIIYQWGLEPLGLLGIASAFAYVACGAIRLARFNVLAMHAASENKTYFTGLPIPLAAGILMSLVMCHQQVFATPATKQLHVFLLLTCVSYLMVSQVRYRAFKDVRLSKMTLTIAACMVLLFVAIASLWQPAFALFVCFASYGIWGLLEEVVAFFRPPPTPPAATHQANNKQP